MSIIDYVTMSVTKTYLHEGTLCRVDYVYQIHPDKAAYYAGIQFTVSAELCGADVLFDQELGGHEFDEHQIGSHDPMPVHRSFMVPCEILNETLGRDAVYLRLFARAPNGDAFTAISPVVKGYF